MYNGVGLPTARGSGSSGRVQSNKFLLRPGGATNAPSSSSSSASAPAVDPGACAAMKEEMAEHQRKRALEARLLELREALEEQGYTEAETDARVAAAARKAADEEEATAAKEAHGSGCWPSGTPL